MDKYEYINRLKEALADLSEEDRESAINYHKELFEDAGNENAAELIEKLGSPEDLAKSIIRESGMLTAPETEEEQNKNIMPDVSEATHTQNTAQQKKNDPAKIALIIVCLILSFPIWIGFVGALFGIIVAIIATIFAVIVSIGAVAVSGIVVGIITLFSAPATGLIYIGAGLIAFSLIFLLLIPGWKLIIRFCKWVGRGIAKCWNKLFGTGKEA